jgi:hypothetical protein
MGKRLRTAGGRWRLLAHERHGERRSHGIGPLDRPSDSPLRVHHDLPVHTEFDELVVAGWLHVEQMDTGTWWMNVGGVTVWVKADRDGRPVSVSVYGPGDYGDPVEGCRYECTRSGGEGAEGG